MKYFSGERPRRGDVVQRVGLIREQNEYRYGDIFLVTGFEEITGFPERHSFCGDISFNPENFQLVSRGKL